MNDALKIGILFSTTGPYGSMGRDAHDGANFAMAEYAVVEGLAIKPVFFDPHAYLAAYLDGSRRLPPYRRHDHLCGTQGSHPARRET
jgi:hypothetical protein